MEIKRFVPKEQCAILHRISLSCSNVQILNFSLRAQLSKQEEDK